MKIEEAIKFLVAESLCVEDVDGNDGAERVREAYRIAIEALSAEAVSREVYDKRTQADEEIIDSYRREFSEVASAEAVQGWIPCSERLPKKGEVVLITNGKGNVRCGQYRSEHDVRDETHYWWWKGKTVETVIAWMPLPDPYKGGDTE